MSQPGLLGLFQERFRLKSFRQPTFLLVPDAVVGGSECNAQVYSSEAWWSKVKGAPNRMVTVWLMFLVASFNFHVKDTDGGDEGCDLCFPPNASLLSTDNKCNIFPNFMRKQLN